MTVNSSTKVNGLNADQLDGLDYTFFARTRTYRTESVQTTGQQLDDGTYKDVAWCGQGDILLSAGPANIDKETDLLESFPSPPLEPGTNASWNVRVDKNGLTDNFNVVVLCIDQFTP